MSYTSEPLETLIKKEDQIRPEYSFVTMKGLRKGGILKKNMHTQNRLRLNFALCLMGVKTTPITDRKAKTLQGERRRVMSQFTVLRYYG